MKKIKKYYKNTIHPITQKKYQKKFVKNFIILSILFLTFSTIIVSFSVTNFQGNIIDKALFSLLKNNSMLTISDWIFFFLSSSVISLMLVNYSFYKCTEKSSLSTMLLGAITATCPPCLLPLLGAVSFGPLIGKLNYPIKIITLLILLTSTVYISNNAKCEIKKR